MNEPSRPIEILFDQALALPKVERASFLAQSCGNDPELAQRVKLLLSACDEAGDFLESPPSELPAVLRERASSTVLGEEIGNRIGRYRLLEKIGEGGSGVVFMAEQEEPVHRKVALKVIKLGMDTKAVMARFAAERQALALMDHPHIARVLDAGATETGRPFFVMELVRGVKLTEFCDTERLSTHARLELVIKVCHAIQHAHQKGVIHRDIKPSNILVTLQDGVPVPKVIDFGIAKATQGRLAGQTQFTALNQFIGTPAYMSPEQAELSSLDIDTRSDIYSLGVLLYELLTGRPPFDSQELLKAGLDEMRRHIRGVEPLRPSTRLSTLANDALTATARNHQTEAPKLIKLVRGDLDWVVMRCLEKDRTRRYATASGLAVDIQRHLNHEPVVARPPTAGYRFQRMVRRNRAVVAASAAISLALIGGTVVSVWEVIRATRAEHEQTSLRKRAENQEKRAITESTRSAHVARFMGEMLLSIGPSVAQGRDTQLLREVLEKTAVRLDTELKGQPEVEADLRETVGSIYYDLGDSTKSEAMHRAALALRRQALGSDHLLAARSLTRLSWALTQQHRAAESETCLREALVVQRERLASDHPEIRSTLISLAWALQTQGNYAEAEGLYREVLAAVRKNNAPEESNAAVPLSGIGVTLFHQGKSPEAEPFLREAVALKRKTSPPNDAPLAQLLINHGRVLAALDKFEEAEFLLREALAMRRALLGNDHVLVAESLHHIGHLMTQQNLLPDAEALLRQALVMQQKKLGGEHTEVSNSLAELANVLAQQGRLAEAETAIRDALAMREKLHNHEHPLVVHMLTTLGSVLIQQNRSKEAETVLRDALALEGRVARKGASMSRTRKMLAGVLTTQKKFAEAELLLLTAYEELKKAGKSEDINEAGEEPMHCYAAWGKPDEAAEWKRKISTRKTPKR